MPEREQRVADFGQSHAQQEERDDPASLGPQDLAPGRPRCSEAQSGTCKKEHACGPGRHRGQQRRSRGIKAPEQQGLANQDRTREGQPDRTAG